MYKRKGTLAFGCLSWDSERYWFKFRVHEGLLLYLDGHANSIKQHTIRALLQSCPSRHFAKAAVVGLCQIGFCQWDFMAPKAFGSMWQRSQLLSFPCVFLSFFVSCQKTFSSACAITTKDLTTRKLSLSGNTSSSHLPRFFFPNPINSLQVGA